MELSDTESLEALKPDSYIKEGEEENVNKTGTEGRKGEEKKKKKMTVMMRLAISELEIALKESHEMLSERDKEIAKLKRDIDHYKQQISKEVAAKTKLAQSFDQSHQQALELEETIQKWQLTLKENQKRIEYLERALQQEHTRSADQEKSYSEIYTKKCLEVEQLTSQLIEARQRLPPRDAASKRAGVVAGACPHVDESQLLFLKQAVYHLLTDSHADEHLRAIVSILDFSAQERKAVYAKIQDRGGRKSNVRTQ